MGRARLGSVALDRVLAVARGGSRGCVRNRGGGALGELLLDAAGLALHERLRLLHALHQVAHAAHAALAVLALAPQRAYAQRTPRRDHAAQGGGVEGG